MIASAGPLRALFALDLFFLLCAVSLAMISSRGPAERTLGRSAAILTEVDTYLDQHFAAIQKQASQPPNQQVILPNFPVDVSFTPAEIQQASREQFRALLLHRSGAVLHERGTSAFHQQGSASVSAGSPGGTIRAAMETLRPVPHRLFVGLGIVLGLVAGLLCFALVRVTSGPARLRTLGAVTLVPSITFLALAVLAWGGLRLAAASTNDYVTHHFLLLAGQLVWAPIRVGLIVMVGGAAFAAAGALLARADARHTP